MSIENLVKSTKDFVVNNKGFCVATTLFTLTAIADSYSTITGIKAGGQEGNSVVKFYMDTLGLETGSISMKLLAASLVIPWSRYTRSNFLLYAHSVGQTLAAATWYLL